MEESKEKLKKQYFNEELYSVIKEMIPEDTYGEFTEFVYDICLRRCYTFNLSKEQLVNDINNLLNNCEKIQFSDNFDKSTTMGHIILSKKLLEINSTYFEKNQNYELMYETLTHEIYHAMSGKKNEDKKIYTGLEFFDEFKKKKGTALNEVFNEVAADMASFSRDKEDESKYIHKTMGYPSITFVVKLLSTSLGISQTELVKAGISSRNDLIQLMLYKIPEDEKKDFLQDFETFEMHLEQLKKYSSIKADDLNDDDKQNLENSYIEISNFALNVLYASIIKDTRPITKELMEEYEYRRDATSEIIQSSKNNFEKKMLDGYKERITSIVNNKSRNRLNSLVIAYNYISRIANQLNSSDIDLLIKTVKQNYPQKKYSIFNKLAQKISKEKGLALFNSKAKTSSVRYSIEPKENKYRRKIRFIDFDDFRQWDNSLVCEKIKKIFFDYQNKRKKNDENAVTPKQIAICDQSENITTEEIDSVDNLFSRLIEEREDTRDGRF